MLERLRLGLMLLLCLPWLAYASEIDIVDPQLSATEDGIVLAADFRFELGPRLEEAVAKGVVLYFVAEFELTRSRWYWFEETVVSRSQVFRLSYHALTRQYRLSTGGLHQSFASLSEALAMLSRLRNWLVIEKTDKGALSRPGETYQAALRLRLDPAQLPRPFQISALGNKEWNLASERKLWQAVLPAVPGEAK